MPAPLPDSLTASIAPEERPLDHRLKRFLFWAIGLMTVGYAFLAYWAYSRIEHDSHEWTTLAAGRGLAPAQYRIGIYFTADFLQTLTHLRFHQVFALADLLCVAVSLACIFFLLTRLRSFRTANVDGQWAQVLLGLLLAQVYLVWTLWFQEPETMLSLALLSASALLCSGYLRVPRAMLAVSLLLVAVLGATIRADAITAMLVGMLVANLLGRGSKTASASAPTAWVVPAAFAGIVIAVGIEWLITHRLFSHTARSAPVFQLLNNLHAANGAVACACVLGPWVLTIWLARRAWATLPIWLQGVAIGSVLHFLMFLTFGMSEEVRIFLPFTLVLLPLSATLLYGWFRGDTETSAQV